MCNLFYGYKNGELDGKIQTADKVGVMNDDHYICSQWIYGMKLAEHQRVIKEASERAFFFKNKESLLKDSTMINIISHLEPNDSIFVMLRNGVNVKIKCEKSIRTL